MHASVVNENTNSNGNNIDQNFENHTMSPSLLQQRQQQALPQQHTPPVSDSQGQTLTQQNQMEQTSPRLIESSQQQPQNQQKQHQQPLQQVQHMQMSIQDQSQEVPVTDHMNQVDLIDHQDIQTQNEPDQQQQSQSATEYQGHESDQQESQDKLLDEFTKHHQQDPAQDETKVAPIVDTPDDSNLILGMNSVEHIENHTGSVQPLNDESDSNSQLPCATASTTNSTMEQQQPVDNGVA